MKIDTEISPLAYICITLPANSTASPETWMVLLLLQKCCKFHAEIFNHVVNLKKRIFSHCPYVSLGVALMTTAANI